MWPRTASSLPIPRQNAIMSVFQVPAAHHSNEHMPVLLVIALGLLAPAARASFTLLDPSDYRPHFDRLPEVGGITGIAAAEWAEEWLPFIDLPETEPELLAAYYYRTKVRTPLND